MPTWQLFVKSHVGKSYTIDIEDPKPEGTTVEGLKKMVQTKIGIPVHEQRLIYGGKQLEDDKRLGYYPSLGHHATIYLVLRMVGGASRMNRIDKSLHTTDTCIISLEDGESVKMPCGHAISPDYLLEYCCNEISAKKYEIHCPYCNAEWTIDILAKYGGADRRELTLIEEGFSVNFCDQTGNDITQCPGCSSYCTRVDTDKNSMLCRICTKSKGRTYRFCFECNDDWKNGLNETFCGNKDCGSANEQLKEILRIRNCEEKEVVGVKCPETRQCPNDDCKALIEHVKDCKHMKCRICKTEFCFICLRRRIDGCWQCGSYNTKCVPAPRQA